MAIYQSMNTACRSTASTTGCAHVHSASTARKVGHHSRRLLATGFGPAFGPGLQWGYGVGLGVGAWVEGSG